MLDSSPSKLALRRPAVDVKRLDDGGLILRSPYAMASRGFGPVEWLRQGAGAAPERGLVATRTAGGDWRRLVYGAALEKIEAVARVFAERHTDETVPVALLCEDGVENAVLRIGLMERGLAVLPIASDWALLGENLGYFVSLVEQVRPGFAYAPDEELFAQAVKFIGAQDRAQVGAQVGTESGEGGTEGGAESGEAPARILGLVREEGSARAVAFGQSQIAAAQGALAQLWPFLAEKPPLIVNALPWHSGEGCCFGLDLALATGGTLYLAEGGRAGRLEMLGEIAPTIYVDDAEGLEALIAPIEDDAGLRRVLLKDLDLMVCAGAPPGREFRERLDAACLAEFGRPVNLACFWGTGESLGGGLSIHGVAEDEENIGLPLPAGLVRLAPLGDQLEIRLKGPAQASGYYLGGALHDLETDEEGYRPTGWAGRLADPIRPFKGVLLERRISP